MDEEKGNFRGKLFGGFNRNDVISYIESAAAKFNETEEERDRLLEENGRLSGEAAELRASLEESRRQYEESGAKLRAEMEAAVAAVTEEKDGVILELRRENARLLEDMEKERSRTFSRRKEELDSAEEAVRELIRRCGDIKADMAVNVTNLRRRVLDSLESVENVADELSVRLNRMLETINGLRDE